MKLMKAMEYCHENVFLNFFIIEYIKYLFTNYFIFIYTEVYLDT